jgi:hypothetical protein
MGGYPPVIVPSFPRGSGGIVVGLLAVPESPSFRGRSGFEPAYKNLENLFLSFCFSRIQVVISGVSILQLA